MQKIVIATNNQHKIKELGEILCDYPFEFVSLRDFPAQEPPDETGDTYLDNALIKARAACSDTGYCALADDSGIEVFHLGHEPGVHSARYLSVSATAQEKYQSILDRMAAVPKEDRGARFCCAMALVHPDGREWTAQATCEGFIASTAAGLDGFGFDPIFFVPPFAKTMAQLSPAIKNVVSHRARSVHRLFQALAQVASYPHL